MEASEVNFLAPQKGSKSPAPSRDQKGIAEGIAQKEIDIGLKKAGPAPSKEEKALAEGIAKKEIAIDTGKEPSTKSKSFLGGLFKSGGKSPKPLSPKVGLNPIP